MLPERRWLIWAIIAGRGYGKSRTGAETVRFWAEEHPGIRIALVARTAADARDVMVEGPSGILAVAHPEFLPHYEPSKRKVTWPNGTTAHTYSADEPDLLRGPQHHKAWVDEMAAWRHLEAWAQLQYGMRLGQNPQTVMTTTPRPIPLLKQILARAGTVTTRGSTFDNRANLAQPFLEEMLATVAGTRIGRQELEGEILDDVEGALWTEGLLQRQRWTAGGPGTRNFPRLARVVVGVDPGISQGKDADGHGIVVTGRDADGRGFVLDDAGDLQGPPSLWAETALDKAERWNADAIVVERNRGGDMVKHTLILHCQGGVGEDGKVRPRRRTPRIIEVYAADGKDIRAEPFVGMYEHSRIWHVREFPILEQQMCTWVPGSGIKSPNSLDALIHTLHELFPPRDGIQMHREKPEGF